jgi:L-ascorbate metabolism protein UlaG (beta-lactamase superfamily)
MRIRFLGHAAFLIVTEKGTRIITDPYQPGAFGGAIGHAPIPETADIVTISHQHMDHNDAKNLPGTVTVFDQPGEYEELGVRLKGVSTYHDDRRGQERGPNIAWVIGADGLQVCHLGDLGMALEAEHVTAVGPIDVLIIPVGGTFTIDAAGATRVVEALKPRLVIPMHYRTPKVKLNIDYVDSFLRDKPNVRRVGGSDIEVTPDTLPKVPYEIWVLEPAL